MTTATPEGFTSSPLRTFHTHHIRDIDLDHRGQQSSHDGCCRGGHAAASPSSPISPTLMVRRQLEQVHAAVAATGSQQRGLDAGGAEGEGVNGGLPRAPPQSEGLGRPQE